MGVDLSSAQRLTRYAKRHRLGGRVVATGALRGQTKALARREEDKRYARSRRWARHQHTQDAKLWCSWRPFGVPRLHPAARRGVRWRVLERFEIGDEIIDLRRR